jgi:CDP-paratose 2-epimerase
MIEEITGKRPEVKFEPGRHADLLYFICDSSKAEKNFGWRATVPPRQGVERLLQWIREEIKIFKN